MISPNYLKLINRVKEKHPELKDEIEKLDFGCLMILQRYGYEYLYKYGDGLNGLDFYEKSGNHIVFFEEGIETRHIEYYNIEKVIGQLDLYILSKALGDRYFISCDYLYNYGVTTLEEICKLPSGNIETYPNELLEQLYQLI